MTTNNSSKVVGKIGLGLLLLLVFVADCLTHNAPSPSKDVWKLRKSNNLGYIEPLGNGNRSKTLISRFGAAASNYTLPTPQEKPFWSTPYSKAQAKGCQLQNLLTRIRELGESEYVSRFTSLNSLAANGWTNTPVNMGSGIKQLLQSVRTPLASINVDFANTENVNVESKHDGHGGTYKGVPTRGMYYEVYNAQQGAIVAYRNYGPAYITSHDPSWNNKPMPALKQWSDVVFLTWMSMTTTEERENLRYVMRLMVMNEDTQDIVSEALKNDGIASGVPLAWPGHTFSPSNNGGRGLKPFQAVLGTPNISGVAWMLINHRDELNYRNIESITVWDKSGMENQDAGFLLCMMVRLGQG